MAFDFSTLVTDRTQQDVAYARQLAEKLVTGTATEVEIAEWNSFTLKGVYNHTDLNRVTAAMEALKLRLEGYGYAVPGYQKIEIEHPSVSEKLPYGYAKLEYIESTGTQYCSIPPVNTTGDFELAFDVTPVQYATWSCLLTNIGKGGIWVGKVNTGTFSLRTYSGSNHVNATLPELNKRLSVNVKCVTGTSSFYLNGVSQGTASVAYTETASCALLSDGAGSGFIGRLYSCQIYESGVLVRNFVPCINPNGVVGLYDTATKAFFGNAGTGAFISGARVGITLPEEYTQVEYIQSSGTQYIDAGVFLNNNSKVVADCEITYSTGWAMFLGSYGSSDRFSWWTNGAKISPYYGATGKNADGVTGRTTLIADKNIWSDGVSEFSFPETSFVAAHSMYLFSVNNGGDYPKAPLKLYSCQVYDNGTLVRDMIPVVRKQDEEAGLYDLVHGVFYQNAGTGTFATGNVIPRPSQPIVTDPYTWYEFDWPTPEAMTMYLLNVAAIRTVLSVLQSTPRVPLDMEKLMVQEANDIEQIVLDVYRQITIMPTTFIPCGEALCGGDNL